MKFVKLALGGPDKDKLLETMRLLLSFIYAYISVPNTLAWMGTYKESLRAGGAMDVIMPITIKAEKIPSSDDEHCLTESSGDEPALITTKIIHFQRHGQGYHNLLGDISKEFGRNFDIDDPNPSTNPFVRPEIQDSPLTHIGRTEATSRQSQVSSLEPQVVIVSPLHRAIQTALITFNYHHQNGVPFVAHEGCREQLGLLTCNKAHPLSQTKIDFPTVDFSLISHREEDTLWSPHERERPFDEAKRVYEFLTGFIMLRSEEELAVVGHSAWLFSMCNCVINCGGDNALESWFKTSEIRSMKVSFYKSSSS